MQDMFSSGQRLQHFIQDFLTFSVLETGELRMQFDEDDMNACLSEVCRFWSNRFQERGLALYFLANDKLTPLRLMRQNPARHFQSSGKCIEVHAARRHGLAARGTVHVGTPRREQTVPAMGSAAVRR